MKKLVKYKIMIPYGRQDINQEDIDAVYNILKSDFLTQGPTLPKFEQVIASYCDVKHGVAVNSATSALHIACLALGLSKGDILWTTPITFVASANCALYCGADVDFVDIDSDTYNMSSSKLEEKLVLAKKNNKLPKIVIPVHFAGQSCDMKRINELSKIYGFHIIEDASHAIGSKYLDKSVGNCQFSDITVFSFHPVKIITTAEGGLATTNSDELASKMELFRSHGITRNPELMTKESEGGWYYQQIALGFNYRMTELQAALGISQMQRLNEFVAMRHDIAKRYNEMLMGFPLTLPWQHSDNYSAFHLYVIRLRLDLISKSHQKVFEDLREAGIGVNLHYIPVHLQPYYKDMGFKVGDFSEAEKYYTEAITLPMYPNLSEQEQDEVVEALKKVLLG